MKRTVVIGDIHGCFDELIELLEKVQLTDDDFVLSLGDIVDRGNKSKEVYQFFKHRNNAKVLVGNHERKHQNKVLSYAQEIVKVQFGNEYEEFLDWISTLDYFYETDEAIIVHAAFEHDKTIQQQKEEVLSGSTSGERHLAKKYGTEQYWNDFYQGTKPIIYGHHIVGDTPKIKHNTYGIDTGACHGGYLTAVELPTFKIYQVKVQQDYWQEEQKKWQIPVLKAKNWNDMEIMTIQNQINRLNYIEDTDVKNYLQDMKKWLIELDNLTKIIKDLLEKKCTNLQKQFGKNFNKEVSQYQYKTLLFKANANTLTLEDIKKSINTPNKIIKLKQELTE